MQTYAMCLSWFWIHIPNAHSHFLKQRQGTFCNLKVVFSTSQIMFVFPWNNFIAADGPENSVPAIGCVAIKFLLLGWLAIPSQIGNFVEPPQKQSFALLLPQNLGTTVSATSTGTETITKSACISLQMLPSITQLNCLIKCFRWYQSHKS
jgi:hypothetical protein